MTPDGGLIGHIIFIALLCATMVLVAVRTKRLLAFLRLGAPDNRFDRPWSRLKTVAINVLGRRRLLYDPLAGTVPLLIFYGFIIITLGTMQLTAGGISSGLVLQAVGGNPVFQF